MDGDTEITGEVIRAALAVHRELGPGLLESAYRACLVKELEAMGLRVESEVPLPISYRGIRLECGYRLDLLVDGELIVEVKSVHTLEPLHTAQVLTYLRMSGRPLGLLINFNVFLLKDGLRRIILSLPPLGSLRAPPRSPSSAVRSINPRDAKDPEDADR